MPVKKGTRKTTKSAAVTEDVATEDVVTKVSRGKADGAKAVHVEPADIIASLNNAVSSINSVFQMRDQLIAQVEQLKEEIGLGRETCIEQSLLEGLKREQDAYRYDYDTRKKRMEQESKDLEDACESRLKQAEEEHGAKLKLQAADQTARLKVEHEDHERTLKLERDDFEREQKRFEEERTAFEDKVKAFEDERKRMKDCLVSELNRDNAHQTKVLELNHQKVMEQLRGELKLEQASKSKFESLLGEARVQNDKLADQMSTLSREALASASSSSMASKLQDIVSQISIAGPSGRGGS